MAPLTKAMVVMAVKIICLKGAFSSAASGLEKPHEQLCSSPTSARSCWAPWGAGPPNRGPTTAARSAPSRHQRCCCIVAVFWGETPGIWEGGRAPTSAFLGSK